MASLTEGSLSIVGLKIKENRHPYSGVFFLKPFFFSSQKDTLQYFKCISWSRRSFSFDDVGSSSPRYNPHSPLYSPPYDYEFKTIDDEVEELPSPEFSPLKINQVGVTISKCKNNYVCRELSCPSRVGVTISKLNNTHVSALLD